MEKICKVCGYHLYKQVNDCCVALGIPEEPVVEEPVVETPLEEEEEVEEEAEEVLNDESLEAYLEELPVKELKKLCKEDDLSVKGNKAALVARLLE